MRSLAWNDPCQQVALVILILASLVAGPASAKVRAGGQAPPFELKDPAGQVFALAGLLQAGPVVIWFADVGGDVSVDVRQLDAVARANGTRLLLIPVVGPDAGQAAGLAQSHPEVVVLHDADGRVTETYTGEFVVGVAPRENLYVLRATGIVRAVRFYPGIPPQTLANLLQSGD